MINAATTEYNTKCPNCGQEAPVVLRGLSARCAACGAKRSHFATSSVELAGQPSRFTGIAATVVGATVLVLGFALALLLGLLAQAIWPASIVGWALAIPIAIVTLFFGLALLFGGHRLRRKGGETQRSVQLKAIRALVAHKAGSITAADVATRLSLSEAEADALLTEIAKDPQANVSIEVDDHGRIHYEFDKADKRWRVLDETAPRAADVGEPLDEVVHTPEIIERRAKR
jgi:uncharacterized membrane protein YqjE